MNHLAERCRNQVVCRLDNALYQKNHFVLLTSNVNNTKWFFTRQQFIWRIVLSTLRATGMLCGISTRISLPVFVPVLSNKTECGSIFLLKCSDLVWSICLFVCLSVCLFVCLFVLSKVKTRRAGATLLFSSIDSWPTKLAWCAIFQLHRHCP